MTRDELNQFLESLDCENDVLSRWTRGMPPKPEPAKPQRLDTDFSALIDGRIAAALGEHRRFQRDVLAMLVAEIRAETATELAAEVRRLTVEIGDLRSALDELRALLRAEHAKTIDMPSPLGRGLH